MKRIYLDVDTQYDFCDPHGALFVTGAPDAIVQSARLVRAAVRTGDLVLGSVDSHTHEAWEFATNANRGPNGEKPNFPPHCVKGTHGWLKVPETLPERFEFVPIDAREPNVSPRSQAIYFEKEVYSLFANPNASRLLDRIVAHDPVEFVVFGVATDYCVRAATLGLREWASVRAGRVAESRVVLVRDAIAGVAPDSSERALDEMRANGTMIVSCDEVLARV